MRLFFAAWPPAEAAAALAAWSAQAQAATGGRATQEEKIHLTLAFLGEADEAKAIQAARAVRARRHGLPIDEARHWKHNDIVWVGPRQTPAELAALVETLRLELYRREFILDRRSFAAHVTLIRKARVAALPPLPVVRWPVDEFLLVKSTVTGKGASYAPLERFALE